MHTAPYFTAFAFMIVVLALRVVRLRRRHKVSLGDGGVPDLERAMRVFGNCVEYVPIGLILLVCLEFVQAPVWYMHLAGMTLLMGRTLHAMGLGRANGPSAGRVAGMILTFASLLISGIGITLFSFWTAHAFDR